MIPPNHSSAIATFMARLAATPERILIRVVESGEVHELSYARLYRSACQVAQGLREFGVRRGDRIVVGLSTSEALFHTYLGALLSGVVPVLVPGPRKKIPLEVYGGHIGLLAGAIEARLFVADAGAPQDLGEHLPIPVARPEQLALDGGAPEVDAAPRGELIAHLQATSGSTGMPRLAKVRHQNIAANVSAIGQAIRHRQGDVLLSWLPLSHDMGLIGVSYALFWDCPLVMTDPMNFARNPLSWLHMMQRFQGTLSPAPNSAFKICARLGERAGLEGLDLSSWRVALCGAEPIHADTLSHFQRVFGARGFREQTLFPVYGLAETTLAAAMPGVETPPHIDEIDTGEVQRTRRCLPATQPGAAMRNVSVGKAIPGHQLRIVNAEGQPLPPRHVGEVEFSGPSVIQGYWGYEVPDPALKRPDGFLRTGDLGYVDETGRLYITGRQKDIIIANGRNLIPFQIEEDVSSLIGSTLPNGVAAVGITDPLTNSERVHLIIESAELPRPGQEAEERQIRDRLEQAFGLTGITLHWRPKGWNPKTTSGKLQRYRCREKLLEELEPTSHQAGSSSHGARR